MALLHMDCEAALGLLESDQAAAHAKILHLREQVADISAGVRTLSHRLHPSILEHLGTAAALESLLDEFAEREGILASFYVNRVPEDLPLAVATGFYRIAQEALRNVSKHAGVAHVKISLYRPEAIGDDRSGLVLEIADSGRGFDLEQHTPGLGLISMKERARLLGAALHLHSVPRHGTTIKVELPLPAPGAAPAPTPGWILCRSPYSSERDNRFRAKESPRRNKSSGRKRSRPPRRETLPQAALRESYPPCW